MTLSQRTANFFSCVWGIKDQDLSQFLIKKGAKELSLNRADLDFLVLARLREIIHHAQKTSNYYAKTFLEQGVSFSDLDSIDDLKRFPCLTKENLRQSLPDIISGGKVLSSWKQSTTGGTTGSPLPFYCNNQALWKKNAFTKAFDLWYGRRTGDRVAYLWGATQDFFEGHTLGSKLRRLTYQHHLMLPSSPLDDEILNDYLKKLLEFKPAFLQAYPSSLYELCLFLKRKKVRIPTLRGCAVTAEVLEKSQRLSIEETLGFKVYNWYGSRELGRVASECVAHDGLHINEPSVFVEIEADSSLPDGYGHLIITDLINRATPMIRYRTGDIARFQNKECTCGRSLRKIENIMGRTTDLIVLPGGRKIRMTNHCDVRQLKEIQIVQKGQTKFLIRYVKGSEFTKYSLNDFESNFKLIAGNDIDFSFEEVGNIHREQSGKVRLVVSELY